MARRKDSARPHVRKGRVARERRQKRAQLGNLLRGIESAGMFAELERIGPASVRDAALKLRGKA